MEQKLQAVALETLESSVFTVFYQNTPLLTAGNREHFNTMTIGWGGLGTLWSLPVCTVYVRPQRYTYEFMEQSDYFTVSVFGEQYKDAMALCGSRSGRDVDKVKECGLTAAFAEGDAPYFEEAELVLVCRKLYADDLKSEKFIDTAVDEKVYPAHDYHRVYIGRVVQVLKK